MNKSAITQDLSVERLREILACRLEPAPYGGRHICLSVTTRRGQTIHEMLADIVECCDSTDEAAQVLRGVRVDKIGKDMIAYWPNFWLHAHS